MKNSSLYNSIMSSVSDIVKNHINEMAKSVLKTIDKKLWLTISSIISRNRSTEAEFIKPKGDDKDMLLQRYVAALLIMKKSCPETVEDINDIKTFKLVGKKVIELGGTFKEIKDLYNKNSSKDAGEQPTLKDAEPKDTNEINNDGEIDINSKSGWDSLFGDTSDEDNSDGFFAAFDDSPEEGVTYTVDKMLTPLDKNADILPILYQLYGLSSMPGFKYIKPKDDYNYLIYTENNRNYTTKGKALYKTLLEDKKWKEYSGNINNDDLLYEIGLSYNSHLLQTTDKLVTSGKYVLPLNSVDFDNKPIVMQNHIIHNYSNLIHGHSLQKLTNYVDYVDRYNETLNEYKKIPEVYEPFSKNSLITSILLSPDKGMRLIKYFDVTYEANMPYQQKNGNYMAYVTDYNKYSVQIYSPDWLQQGRPYLTIWFSVKYKLEFTGTVNYYDEVRNDDKKQELADKKQASKNETRKYRTFMKICKDKAYHLINITLAEQTAFRQIKYDKECYPYIVASGKDLKPNYHINATIICTEWWRHRNRRPTDIMRKIRVYQRHEYPYTYKNITDIMKANINSDVIGAVSDTDDFVIATTELKNGYREHKLFLSDKGKKLYDTMMSKYK